jgi:putative OPT family oligopeptide transporter
MESGKKSLPSNAYTPLKPGEKYVPFVPADSKVPEITPRSVIVGLIMAILFSFACAYSGLKAGQVFEAAIPIAILAVGLSGLFKRKSTILENVIIQSIGASSGVVVAGAIFTIPALFMIKDADPKLYHIFLSALLGGCLGLLFMIPLRRYFMVEQHGTLPFPEATATTEILVSGESGGKQAKVLFTSMMLGGLFDFLVETVRLWNASLKTTLWGFGQALHEKTNLVLKMEAQSLFLGLGYIVGLRYAAVICAGSFLSWWVLVPAMGYIGDYVTVAVPPAKATLDKLGSDDLFKFYVRYIGIGAIAAAGILGIIKNSKIIYSSFALGFSEIFSRKAESGEAAERTDRDIKMKNVLLMIGGVAILIWVFFGIMSGFGIGAIGLGVALILSFLFTTVAGLATATVGTNPVSGMTLVTLIIASVALVKAGLSGTSGILIALVIGGVVCTSLSVAGGFVTDLKIGYWIGATPRNQERYKFLGILVSAFFVGIAILVIDKAFGFSLPDGSPNPAIPAPQANVMKSIITSLMDPNAEIPWLLYAIGIMVTLCMEMAKVPPLAFALGMYLPMQLNTPLLVGGLVAWLVARSGKGDQKLSEAINQRGTLIASGFIAGASLFGVFGAILRTVDLNRFLSVGVPYIFDKAKGIWEEGEPTAYFAGYGHIVGLLLFVGLAAYMYLDSRRARPED